MISEEQAFEISEEIARGGPCESCGSDWVNHELLHADDCEYWQHVSEEDDYE